VGIEDIRSGMDESFRKFLVVGSKGTLTRWSWEGETASKVDSLKSIHLLERMDGIPSKAYSRTSSSPPVLTASMMEWTGDVVLVTACNNSTLSIYLVNNKENHPLEVEFVGQTSTPLQSRVLDLSLVPTFQDREYTIHVTDENGQTAVVVVNFAYAKTNQRPRLFKLVHCFGTWHDDQFKDTLVRPPQALEPIAKRKFKLNGSAPATLTLGQGGEVEVEKEEEEKQVLRLHQGTKISSLAVLRSSDKDCCLISSGAEDGLVKFWSVTDKGWSLLGQFQCKGPAVTKVVGCVGGQEALEVEGKEKISRTIGRVVLADAAGAIYCVKGWPP